jgi:aldehyde dehydrogenase (NAD(P)+)
MTPKTMQKADVLDDLVQGERAWAALPLSGRLALLDDLQASVLEHAAEWVDVASRIKQLPPDSPLVGEEWITGPYPFLGSVAALRQSLTALPR